MQEIGRAIQRVNDPAAGRILACDFIAFLAQKPISRAGVHQLFFDHCLCGFVGTADKITRSFGADLQVFNLAKILEQTAPCFAGGFHHHVQVCTASHLLGPWLGVKRGV